MGKKIKKYTPIEHVKDRLKRAKDRVLARLFFGFGRKRRKKNKKKTKSRETLELMETLASSSSFSHM